MEILFISHKYPPTIGGMEKQSFELVSRAEKKHKVHKVVLDKSKENVVVFFWKLKKRVKKILQENPGIDIIHLNDGLMGYFGLWLQSYTKIPTIVTFHGLDIVFPNKWFQTKLVPRFRNYDAFINVSEATSQECINRGFDPKKINTVANGVDHDLATMQVNEAAIKKNFLAQHNINLDEKKILIALGRPVKRKGFSWFLENVLPKLDDDVLFIMMGPRKGKVKKPLWQKIMPQKWVDEIMLFLGMTSDETNIIQILEKKPDIAAKVIETGGIPFADVMGLLGLADIFVMPNIKVHGDAEGFGLVALEASLRGTTVLASGMEGITEAIKDGKNGYLLPSENVDAWLEKINELVSNPKQLQVLGEQFKQFTLDTYGWDKMVDGYVEVFEKVVDKK